jgi:uncharacterized protein
VTVRRIAVVGAGVSGLTAAYLLQRTSWVTLYEADPRLGGHAHTHELPTSDGRTVGVDSGFIVHNRRTYPHLLRLFDELGVATQESEMSMSIRCDGCGLEYAGARGLTGIFAQPRRAVDPRFIGLLAQVRRFHRASSRLLDREARRDAADVTASITLGDFLDAGHFSPYFVHHFVVPLVSAVWSCGPDLVTDYPAAYLFTFLRHHGMLSVSGSPQWRTVVGGSNAYVERAVKELNAVRIATPVRSVRRTGAGVDVHDADGGAETFDAAVIATHADQALALLGSPTTAQSLALGAFAYSRNATVLHADTSVLPRARAAHASWNYRMPVCTADAGRVRVSYDMNRLQHSDVPDRFLVTLNDDGAIPAGRTIERMVYEHPIYTPAALAAQRRLPELNDGVLAFAGAYHGWGFHEDGCRSGVAAAESLGSGWPSR